MLRAGADRHIGATYRTVDRAELRRAIEPHSVEAWCAGHEKAFAGLLAQTEQGQQRSVSSD